jgi:peptide methionine sulfoxide reductase MsrA
MEKPFDVVDGVLATTSGYTGGYQAGGCTPGSRVCQIGLYDETTYRLSSTEPCFDCKITL